MTAVAVVVACLSALTALHIVLDHIRQRARNDLLHDLIAEIRALRKAAER